MANVKDDEFETLEFADESEYMNDGAPDNESDIADRLVEITVAEMIADWFGRSFIESDRELAKSIIQYVGKS